MAGEAELTRCSADAGRRPRVWHAYRSARGARWRRLAAARLARVSLDVRSVLAVPGKPDERSEPSELK